MATRRKPRSSPPAGALPWMRQVLDGIEHRGEHVLAEVHKGVSRHMPASQRRVLRDLAKQTRRMRTGARKRVRKRIRDLERSAERLFARMDQRSAKVLGTVLASLNIATRADVRRLRQRLTLLERRVAARGANVKGTGGHAKAGPVAGREKLSA